jgi:uroporphyrinogen-III decarboxylase
MYHELIELTLGQFAIIFPHWFRGPFGVATHLRGTNEMLMDLYLNPGFVHELMNLITETRKQWYGERARFLGSQVEEGVLANDEVNSPSLSASLYDDFVLPYEKSLCDYHNGIAYWHSCGNINSLLESIARIKRINILHIGPWTDMKKAKDIFRDDSSYEICLMPTRDVYSRDREDMKSQIQRIKKTMKYSTFSIRADSFQVVGNIGANINAIKQWSSIARNELLNEV